MHSDQVNSTQTELDAQITTRKELLALAYEQYQDVWKRIRQTSQGGPGGHPNVAGDVDHEKHKAGLYRELKEIEERIATLEGPITHESYGV